MEAEANTGAETTNPNAGMSQNKCMEGIKKALKHPTVRFLREHMEKAGCPVWARILMAVNCKDQTSAGGYISRYGVSVCCNHMTYQDEINQVLIHELIHAYDDCRAKNLDWKNCAHHACSEIRANHLSGDCHYKRELLRGFMKIRGHEQIINIRLHGLMKSLPDTGAYPQLSPSYGITEMHRDEFLMNLYREKECVRRRALKSVEKNPHCSKLAAENAIESVWDICYNDTYPFDRAP